MKKLLKFVDENLLKALVAFLLIFVPVYPKLPAIDIPHTWVYIRLEDFLIAVAVAIFAVQFMRRKIRLFKPLAIPIFAYWIVGFISLMISLLIIGPTLAQFFPNVAILSYLRRIEYMILFFVGFASVTNKKDLGFFIGALLIGNLIVLTYGVGQRYYVELWGLFPHFFEKYSFCFPSIQTTNEEFAKGTPMCLPKEGRITSLFGGHYDLSAYLVLLIPAFLAFSISVKNVVKKIPLFLFTTGLVFLLILTSSRISFAAYIVGSIATLFFIQRKKYIIPLVIVTIILSSITPNGVLDRFMKTFRFTNVVVNDQGQVVGTTGSELSADLQKKLAANKKAIEKTQFEALPVGSSIIGLGQGTATSQAILKSSLHGKDIDKYAFGAIQISSVSGTFLVQKALVYDISFTTRFQSEWPNAWRAFTKNPLTGSGFATITMATDNSLLRSLGEVGALGFASFISFFIVWYFFMKKRAYAAPKTIQFWALGLSGGLIGLFINAVMIDVFEASKVAESLWLILGVTAGSVVLTTENKGGYIADIKRMLLSVPFLCLYMIIGTFSIVGYSMDNFFVADDFTWMKWAATANPQSLMASFYDAQGFFLRPISKIIFFALYTLNAFKPFGYYLVNTALHASINLLMFWFLYIVFKNKWVAFVGALFFAFLPIHHQNLFWLSTNSITVSTFFVLAGLIAFYYARVRKNIMLYVISVVSFLLAPFSYEGAIIFMPLVFLMDVTLLPHVMKRMKTKSFWVIYMFLGLVTALYLVVRMHAHAAGFSGDYNYNYSKLLPNSLGNFAGYLTGFLIGVPGLTVFDTLREMLKTYFVQVSIAIVVLIATVTSLIAYTKPFKHFHMKDYTIGLFGLGFAIIALLPFLGLGNISARYDFLASIGFTVALIFVLQKIFTRKNTKFIYVILMVFIVVNCVQVLILERQWHDSSRIIYRTLVDFRTDYGTLDNERHFLVYNVPVTYKHAFVYPYGFEDSLWFVYRDRLPQIHKTDTYQHAVDIYRGIDMPASYIYIFTYENGRLVRIKSNDFK